MTTSGDYFDSFSAGTQPLRRGSLEFVSTSCGVEVREHGSILWSDDLSDDPPRSVRSAPRRISTTLTRSLWANATGGCVVSLCEEGTGVRLAAWHGRAGKRLWTRHVPLPPPAPFTDRDPPPGNSAEDLYAFLPAGVGSLALCIQRTSRSSFQSVGESSGSELVVDLPRFEAQLDLIGLDPGSGESVWEAQHPGVHVDIVEREHFQGLYAAGRMFGEVDWTTGAGRRLLTTPRAKLAWPRAVGDLAICAFHTRGVLHVVAVNRATTAVRSSHQLKVRANRELGLYLTGEVGMVNVDSQTYIPLNNDMRPLSVIKAPGWYRALHLQDNVLELWTSHQTLRICPNSGEVLHRSRF
jgi:hypothetical protein